MTPLEQFLTVFKSFSDAIIDSYFICDADRNIVDFNRAFFSLLPRQVARGLKGKKCYDVIQHDICKDRCIAHQCWTDKRHVRFDEINSQIPQTEGQIRFILSGMPILGPNGEPAGCVEIQRNVTDEAVVQVKYQEILDTEARERERLAQQIRSRTRDVLETNQVLLRVQKELLSYKKGLMV
ncbi:MAG TPA: PAS domain-containing protein [Polyangia bacterium]|jgi:PAS domain-containing protein